MHFSTTLRKVCHHHISSINLFHSDRTEKLVNALDLISFFTSISQVFHSLLLEEHFFKRSCQKGIGQPKTKTTNLLRRG